MRLQRTRLSLIIRPTRHLRWGDGGHDGSRYMIFLDEHAIRCPAGSFIFIPAATPRGFRVGSVASRKLNLYLPASMVGNFDT